MAQSQESRNGVSARPSKDDVLADLLRIDRGEDVEKPVVRADDEVEEETGKVDEHGRSVEDDEDLDELDVDDDQDDDEDEDEAHGRRSARRKVDDDDEDEDEEDDADKEDEEDEEDEDADKARGAAGKAKDEPAPKKDERSKEDLELAQRRAALQKQDKRQREALARDRDAFNRDVAEAKSKIDKEWGPKVARVERFEKLAENVNIDAAAVLIELGLKEDSFEDIARTLYALSPQGRQKPENREAAARLMKQRELQKDSSAVKQELAEIKKKLEDREQQEQGQRALAEFHGELAAAAKATNTPLVRRILEKNATKARQEMELIAHRLLQRDQVPPTARRVVKVYEKQRRRDLEDAGVDVDAMLKTAPAKKTDKTEAAAGGKKPDKAAAAAPGKKGGKPKTRDELRDELERELLEQDRASAPS